MLDDLTDVAAAERFDVPQVLAILVAAFRNDSAARSLYPTDSEYERHFSGFLMAFGGRAFDEGTVDVDASGRAAALWFPPGIEPDGEAIIAYMEDTIPPERLGVLSVGMEIQSAMHPHETHWYLPWMGVVPEAQGSGLGSALLRAGLVRADTDGLPAYLEATSRRNAALYTRQGFRETGVVEAKGYPEIIAMWRLPRGQG